jgi:phage gp36-like protein
MPYITQDALTDLFGADAFDGVTDELWAQVLAGVDDLINSKLAARYVVPVSPVPALLPEIATGLARYQLHYLGGYDEDKNKGLKERYDYAIKMLDELSQGTLLLSGAIHSAPVISASGLAVVSAPARVFTDTALSGY